MKQGWKTTTIQDACEQMNGIWKGAKAPFTTAKILRTTNFSKDCKMKLDDLAIIEVEEKKMNARRLRRGDIIVEKSGGGPKQPVGRVILFDIDDEDFSFCNFTSALRVKNQSEILPEYLHKYLTFLYFEGETEKYQSNLVGFRNLDFKGYVSMSFHYPELSEQQRIVNLLDAEFAKIDTLKANAERNLQNAKDLFQAALKKELEPKEGWQKKKFGDVCKYQKEQGHYSHLKYVGMENIETGSGKLLGLQNGADVLSTTFRFHSGYVMYGRLRPYLKKVFVADFEGCCSTEIFPIETKELLPHLLMYWFLSDAITDRINATCAGCRMPRANMNDVLGFDISVPELSEQQQIVARLDALNEKCKTLQANYEKTIALCDDLKQALLRKAFNGEI